MGGDNRARKRSGASSTESYPVNKKAKTGVAESRNDDKKAGKKHGQVVAKEGVERSKPVTNMSKVVIKPVKKLSPNSGKNYSGKKTKNPKSLLDAVAKEMSGKEPASVNEKKDKKKIKKKSDGKPKRKERKAPMTPAERRASKPNFAMVEGLKSHWNTVRIKATTAAVREKLVQQMASKMEGQVLQVTLRHDASRIVESILQYGTEKQREKILLELLSKLVEIAKTPYGHFVVLKAITYCTGAAEQKKIAAAFVGHFVSLGAHVIGARTVESILQMYAPKFTRGLKAEFYGSKFVVLAPELPRNLAHLRNQLPTKASCLVDHMRDLIQKFVDKGLMEFSFVHNLLWEYTQEIVKEVVDITAAAGKKSRIDDLVNQLVESGPKLMSTKPGAKAMCLIVTHSGVKERKRIMKTLKGHTLESLLHDSAFLAILRLVDVTDDTVTVQKSLLEEIRSPLADIKYTATGEIIGIPYPPLISIAKHRNGNKLLLRLLAPERKCLEPGDESDLFATVPSSSKKLPGMRRREHLAYLKVPLIQVCAQYAGDLIRCRAGGRVLEEVLRTFFPPSTLDSVARTYAGLEVQVAEINEEDMRAFDAADDDDGDDEDEVEVDADEEEEEAENDSGDENVEEMEVDEEEEILMDEEADIEEAQPSVKIASVAELLPIQEDPVAHLLLKKILLFEAAAELQSSSDADEKDVAHSKSEDADGAMTAVDTSMWVAAEAGSSSRFACVLLRHLDEAGRISDWLSCNRGCFSLAAICKVPSACKATQTALEPFKNELVAAAASHAGGKLLLECMSMP